MVLMRRLLALTAVALVGAAAAFGCSSGLSASDAATFCTQEQMDKTACFDQNVYNLCLSCYERCGDNCSAQEMCPEEYLCPGDSPIDAGSL
jgi:cystathionine beta-lyase/cystathionine gamma-synthase